MNKKRNKLLSLVIALVLVSAAVFGMTFSLGGTTTSAKGLRFLSVEHGLNHTLALTADGEVYGWGSNEFGQLGIYTSASGREWTESTNKSTNIPATKLIDKQRLNGEIKRIHDATVSALFENARIVKIACSGNTSYALTSTGILLVWGDNTLSKAGYITTVTNIWGPQMISGSTSPDDYIVDFSVGANHVATIFSPISDFRVGGVGANNFQQSTATLDNTLTSITYLDDFADAKNSHVYAAGNSTFVEYGSKIYSYGFNNTNNALGQITVPTVNGAVPLPTNISEAAVVSTSGAELALSQPAIFGANDIVTSNHVSYKTYAESTLTVKRGAADSAPSRMQAVRMPAGFGGEVSVIVSGNNIYGWGDETKLPVAREIADSTANKPGIITIPGVAAADIKEISMGKYIYDGAGAVTGNIPANLILTETAGVAKVFAWKTQSEGVVDITSRFSGAAKIVSVNAGYNGKISVTDALGRVYEGKIYESADTENISTSEIYPLTAFKEVADGTNLPELTLTAGENTRAFELGAIDTPNTSSMYLSLYKGKASATDALVGNPLYESPKGTKFKYMRPVRDRVNINDKTGGVVFSEYPNADNVAGKYNPDISVVDDTFAFRYEMRTVDVDGQGTFTAIDMVTASKYFGIEYLEAQSGNTAALRVTNAEDILLRIIPRKRTPENLQFKIKVWVAAFDQYGTGLDDKFYYNFQQVEYILHNINNTELKTSTQYNSGDTSKELDKNSPAKENTDFTAFDIDTAINELIALPEFNASADSGKLTSHANSAGFLGSDIDGDRVIFDPEMFNGSDLKPGFYVRDGSSIDQGLVDYFNIKLMTGTMTLALDASFDLSGQTAEVAVKKWFSDVYKNPYGLVVKSVNQNTDSGTSSTEPYFVTFEYQYLRVFSKKTTSGSTGFQARLLAGTSTNTSLISVYLSVKSTINFEIYEATKENPTADTKQNNYIGKYLDSNNNARLNNFVTGNKDIGTASKDNFFIGEKVSISIDKLFKDSTKMRFVKEKSSFINDPDFYEIDVSTTNITIQARGACVFVFTVRVENTVDASEKDITIFTTIKLPQASNALENKENMPSLNSETLLNPTVMFKGGYGEADIDRNIKIVSAIALNPDIANASIVTENGITKLKISPVSDGKARINIKAKYYNTECTYEFVFPVTNLTRYKDRVLVINKSQAIDTNSLTSTIARNNLAPDDIDFSAFTRRLAVVMKEDGTPDITYVDNDGANRTDTSSLVSVSYSSGSKQFLIEADKAISDYLKNKTTIYIKFLDAEKNAYYEISISVQINKIYLAGQDEFVYKAGKDVVSISAADFAPYINANKDNVKIDFVLPGAIEDTGVSRGQRALVSVDREMSLSIKPLENGTQFFDIVIYDYQATLDPVTLEPPRYIVTVMVEVTGITTVLTQREYTMTFAFTALGVFLFLFLIFIIRWSVFMKKRAEQKKIVKKNTMLIKMRDKMHQRPDQSTREQVLKTKLKMEDPKYTKMFGDMKKERTHTNGGTVFGDELNLVVDQSADGKGKKNKKDKKKKSNLEQMRAELEAKKAKLAAMQAADAAPIMDNTLIELDDRAAIDEQIKAKLAEDGDNAFDFDADL